MNIRRRRRLMVVVAILVGLGLATALVMYALRSNIDLFYTPSEILYGRGLIMRINRIRVSSYASVA
ncbi:Heme chaperone CcmE [Tatumella ptyseos]|uniref:Heme chaperone CcmE n=1 Tax=Tatumella ptyseos TaxID=82987 RepID=A0A2X5PFU2_9GAMM|nr:Heme chaperone CcmE [Tatumella ptyseos]